MRRLTTFLVPVAAAAPILLTALPAQAETTPDTTPPTVATKTPTAGATGVSTTTDVTATFSEPVQNVSGSTAKIKVSGTGTAVSAAVAYDSGSNTATLHPNAALAASTKYTVTLTTGIKDLAGNALKSTSWGFTTGTSGGTTSGDTTPPTVTAKTPTAGATGVSTATDVTATFSEPVQNVTGSTAKIKVGGTSTSVSATVAYDSGTHTTTLHPNAALAASTKYTVTLTAGIKDLAGNALQSTSWSFTTGTSGGSTGGGTSPDTPVGPAWVPDGAVAATVVNGSTVYVGGEFTGGYAALSADSGQLLWRGNANGAVRALALSGEGHLLIGGEFTTVGGATHRKLASVDLTNGSVNAAYKGTAGGTVRDIVVVNGVEYFAGAFVNHGGMAQQGLGAVAADTGALVTGFRPTANGTVYALATDGSRLYLGGAFTAVDGLTRNQLASVTLATGSLDSWAPAKACSGNSLFWDLTLNGGTVYGVGRNCASVYAVDTASGRAVFRIRANGDSQAVTMGGDGLLYVGGHFGTVTVGSVTTARTIVAAYDVRGTTPVLQPLSARFVSTYPGVWAMASTSSRLYVGGYFTASGPKVNGQDVHPYLAFFPLG